MFAKLQFNPNPILIKELRSRMRGGRAFITLTVILLALGGISYLLYRMVMVQLQYTSTPISPQIGQALFSGLAFLELMMVCAVTPAVTASAISGEKEKLTYEMLVATPLRPASILNGKLLSAMSYVLILIFAAVPMFSLVFTFGGVTVREMVKALAVLSVVGLMLGVIGLFFSALMGRSGRATVTSYVVLVLMMFVPYFIYLFISTVRQTQPSRWIMVFSPITSLFSALAPSLNGQYPISWFWQFGGGFGPDVFFGTGPISQTSIPRPMYHYSLALFGAISLVLYLLTTRLVQPARRWKIKPRELLVGAGLVAGYAALVALAFYSTSGHYENYLAQNQSDIAQPPGVQTSIQVAVPVQDAPLSQPVLQPPSGVQNSESSLPVVDLPADQQVEIYSQIIRQLYTVDNTYDTPPNFPLLYVLNITDDTSGDPNLTSSLQVEIPTDVRDQVTQALADLPTQVQWVGARDQVPLDPDTQMVADGGALITLGNTQQGKGGDLLVAASLEVGPLVAGGRTYILTSQGDTWQINGNTGNEWLR
jgi:ABC-2 type transport system permease protein